MSSVSRVRGFWPVKHATGAPYNGQASLYFIPASDGTAVFVGDWVKIAGGAQSPTGVPNVTRAGATDQVVGVVVGVLFTGVGDVQNLPQVTNLNTPVYRAASTATYVLVADSPDLIFEAQVSGAALAAAGQIGKNVSPNVAAGSTTSGASGETIDLTTIATTATLPLKLVGWPNRPDNNIGDAYNNAYVMMNNQVFKGGTGTTGT